MHFEMETTLSRSEENLLQYVLLQGADSLAETEEECKARRRFRPARNRQLASLRDEQIIKERHKEDETAGRDVS